MGSTPEGKRVSIEDSLKTLSDAHGSKALHAAFGKLGGQVRAARMAASSKLGTLAKTFIEAMRIWDAQKADGVSKADRVAALEKSLRLAWPERQEFKPEGWCPKCENTGVQYPVGECPGDATCGRTRAHLPHEFRTPCWCALGSRFKDKPKSADDFTGAGTVRKQPKTWSRGGR